MAKREGGVSPWIWGGVGCCLGCVVLPIVAAVVLAGLGVGVMGAMMHSEVVDEAVSRAQADPRVVAALGEPIEKGLLVQGSLEVTDASGSADLSVPLSGPRGSAKLFVVATKQAGEWQYEQLVVQVEGSGERIELPLLPESPAAI